MGAVRVKLVASMIVRNELGRYLRPCINALLGYCDEIRVLDDGSDDGTYEYLSESPLTRVLRNDGPTFFEHEGAARQRLYEWTLQAQPTHILAIDADEFVEDGHRLRGQLDLARAAWSLCIQEIWQAD